MRIAESSYTTERAIMDGPYNDLLDWDYAKVPQLLGNSRTWTVTSEQELVSAWEEACANTTCFSLIEVELAPRDYGPALERLGQRLAERLGQSDGK